MSTQRGQEAPTVANSQIGPSTLELSGAAVLDERWAARYVVAEEYQPVGPTEVAIVRDLACQAAAVDHWSAGSGAVERQVAGQLPGVVVSHIGGFSKRGPAPCRRHSVPTPRIGASATGAEAPPEPGARLRNKYLPGQAQRRV